MNTAEVAEKIGTTARMLRVFLRSSYSTFAAVGSNSRYEFDEKEISTIQKRFNEWHAKGGRAKSTTKKPATPKPRVDKVNPETLQKLRDEAVWVEEGPIVLPDIRDPRVRAEVRRRARQQELELELRLLRVGLHVTQQGNR